MSDLILDESIRESIRKSLENLVAWESVFLAILAVYLIRKACGTTTTEFIKSMFGEFKDMLSMKVTASSINAVLVVGLLAITFIYIVSSPLSNVLRMLSTTSDASNQSSVKFVEFVVLFTITAGIGMLSVLYVKKD